MKYFYIRLLLPFLFSLVLLNTQAQIFQQPLYSTLIDNPAQYTPVENGISLQAFHVRTEFINNDYRLSATPLNEILKLCSNVAREGMNSTLLANSTIRVKKNISAQGYGMTYIEAKGPGLWLFSGKYCFTANLGFITHAGMKNLPGHLALYLFNNGQTTDENRDKPFYSNKSAITLLSYAYLGSGISYSFIQKKNKELRAGIEPRLLLGYYALNIYNKESQYELNAENTVHISNAQYKYATSVSQNISSPVGLGVSVNVGLTYANYKKKPKKTYSYQCPDLRKRPVIQKHLMNYLSLSLNNLGYLTYHHHLQTEQISFSALTLHLDSISAQMPAPSLAKFMDVLKEAENYVGTPLKNKRFYLPASLQITYMHKLNSWLNFTLGWKQRLMFDKESAPLTCSSLMLLPSLYWNNFELGIPFTYTEYHTFHSGIFLKSGPLLLGCNNFSEAIGKRDISTLDFSFGVRLNI